MQQKKLKKSKGPKNAVGGQASSLTSGHACLCDVDSREYKTNGCYCGVAEMETPAEASSNGHSCLCDVESREYREHGCYCGVADMEVPNANQSTKEVVQGDGAPVRVCYNCGEPGHISAACGKPRTHNKFKGRGDRSNKTCHKCKEKGHMSFECPNRSGGIKKTSKVRRDWMPA